MLRGAQRRDDDGAGDDSGGWVLAPAPRGAERPGGRGAAAAQGLPAGHARTDEPRGPRLRAGALPAGRVGHDVRGRALLRGAAVRRGRGKVVRLGEHVHLRAGVRPAAEHDRVGGEPAPGEGGARHVRRRRGLPGWRDVRGADGVRGPGRSSSSGEPRGVPVSSGGERRRWSGSTGARGAGSRRGGEGVARRPSPASAPTSPAGTIVLTSRSAM